MDLSEAKKQFVVYAIPGMNQSQVRPNIAYKSVEGQDLLLDVYYPPDFTFERALPAVLFIHGDGPAELVKDVKDDGQYISWGRLAAASGLIGIPFNHRSADQKLTGMIKVAEDIHDAIAYVRKNAIDLCVEEKRLCLWACSAGVHYLQEAFSATPTFVRCMVAYYGLMDFQQYIETIEPDTPAEKREFILRLFKQYSLINYLQEHPAALPPLFIARAGLDDPTTNASIDSFYSEACSLHAKVELARHSSGRHGFDVLDGDATSRSIIEQTLSFIRQHLLD
jgi:acetyl esterase/lipase